MAEEKHTEIVSDAEQKSRIDEIVENLKAMVNEGNVTHIRIKKGDTTVLNLPMTVGVVGTILGAVAAPWALIIATISTIGLNCTVEVEKKDGEITTIYGKNN